MLPTAMASTDHAIPSAPPLHSIFVAKGKLPGSNGSDARANAAGAGLIIVFIGEALASLSQAW